jgi:hypothetical protein
MTAILLLFYLIMPPSAQTICALWLSQAATQKDLVAACPEGIELEKYQVEFTNIWDGKVYCTKNATAIFAPGNACNLSPTLDNFRMVIIEPARSEKLLCSIQTYRAKPSRMEMVRACSFEAMYAYDADQAELRAMGPAPTPVKPPTVSIPLLTVGSGLYEQVSAASVLATNDTLDWLAWRLLWTGEADKNTIAEKVIAWQNKFDDDIYAAAIAENVPARLLKRILKYESQFWPSWGRKPAGETGMAQVTTNAADQYLRWYDPVYPGADGVTREKLQSEFMASMRCELCSMQMAIDKERENIYIYARILRAYRLSADDWTGALKLWNGEEYQNKLEKG